VPGYAGTSWFTLAAPRGMPMELVEKLNRDAQRGLATPEAAARLDALGVTFTPNTPAEAAAFFKAETAKWGRVIDATNLRLD
jgi:tripartite-type tricarboxylate transporter receptor subunit TctC